MSLFDRLTKAEKIREAISEKNSNIESLCASLKNVCAKYGSRFNEKEKTAFADTISTLKDISKANDLFFHFFYLDDVWSDDPDNGGKDNVGQDRPKHPGLGVV